MLDQTYFDNGHLSSVALYSLVNGTLSPRDTQLLLIHLEHCPACMDAYITALDTAELESPPQDLEQKVLERLEEASPRQDKSPLSAGIWKLAVAVSLTMLLFFGNVFHLLYTSSENLAQQITISSEQPKENKLSQFASGFQQGFNELINRFNDLFDTDAP